jgi:hypothetical protein
MLGNYQVAKQLVAFRVVLSSIQLVSYEILQQVRIIKSAILRDAIERLCAYD